MENTTDDLENLPLDELLALESKTHDAKVQCEIGYRYSCSGLPEGERKAAEWWRKAAEQGDAKSQHFLGICYEHGDGVPADERMAAEWYRKAAEQGDAMAQFRLAECYETGAGVPQDLERALELYLKSLELDGDDAARQDLTDFVQKLRKTKQ